VSAVEEALVATGMVRVCSHDSVRQLLPDRHIGVPIPEPPLRNAREGLNYVVTAMVAGATTKYGPPFEGCVWHDSLDLELADLAHRLLHVQALCVVWLPKTGPQTGDLMLIQVFATPSGRALGGFVSVGPSVSQGSRAEPPPFSPYEYTQRYSQEGNFRMMAAETVRFLRQALGLR
jgi:hypothetical protein